MGIDLLASVVNGDCPAIGLSRVDVQPGCDIFWFHDALAVEGETVKYVGLTANTSVLHLRYDRYRIPVLRP